MNTKRIIAGASAVAAFNALPAHYARIPVGPPAAFATDRRSSGKAAPLKALLPGLGWVGVSGAGLKLHTIISSVTVLQSVQSDFGITIGTGVSAWADQSGAGKDYAQATGGKQPAYAAAALNGFPTVTFDGVSDNMTSALNLGTPGTTPTYVCGVAKQITWNSARRLFGGTSGGSSIILFQTTGTPQILQFNTNTVNSCSPSLGTWCFFECYFSNTTGDFNHWGSTFTTGANAGNSAAGTGREIGSAAGTNFSNVAFAWLCYCNGLPPERSTAAGGNNKIVQAVISKYGTAVST